MLSLIFSQPSLLVRAGLPGPLEPGGSAVAVGADLAVRAYAFFGVFKYLRIFHL